MDDTGLSRFLPRGIARSKEQLDIQTSTERAVLVEANAGSGKTTTLAIRVGEAIANHVPPDEILLLSFTEAARDVLRRRLEFVGIRRSAVDQIQIETFESFAHKTLSALQDAPVPRYMHARDLKPYVVHAMEYALTHWWRLYPDARYDDHHIAIAQTLDALQDLKARLRLNDDIDTEFLEGVYEQYRVTAEQYLTALAYEHIRLGQRDDPEFRGPFDATYDLARGLRDGDIDTRLFDKYRFVGCDELHDFNEAAFQIVRHLISRPGCKFVGVGDKDQVIHATLGASEEFLGRRFASAFSDVKTYPLTTTFRHGPHLAYAVAQFKAKDIESLVARHSGVHIVHYDGTPSDCAAKLVEEVREWQTSDRQSEDCAILMRDWHQSIPIENALRLAGISYQTPPDKGYLQRDEIRFIRGVLAFVLDTFEAIPSEAERAGVVDALCVYGGIAGEREHVTEMVKELARHPHLYKDFYAINICASAPDAPRTRLGMLIAALKRRLPDLRAEDALIEIDRQINLSVTARQIYVHPYDASLVEKTIQGIIGIARASGASLQAFWDGLTDAEQFSKRGRQFGKLLLDTVADAKGKEYGHVIIPFMEKDEFPNVLSPLREEENLFYVGATRAKSSLTLLAPAESGAQSVFIGKLDIEGTAPRANVALERNQHLPRALSLERRYLKSKYEDRQEVKALGAKYDGARKAWYVEAGADIEPFRRWL
ncbi:DNA helicase II [Pandoraea terrae]|uniref:DNA 3'-5' helicase n=2 Tax=Pandoraea terrae TaxID=1537710 RepID=A0A5E4TEQ7_9BURK|nr:DNA helicase II [Pandoraea terrae]